jgi:hypothetical protein
MKKILIAALCFLLALTVFVGCGNDNETVTEGDTEVTYSEEMKDSVEVPEGYPGDLVPIYDDSFISTAAKRDDGSFMVMGFTNDSMEQVVNYYEEILKENETMKMQDASDSYVTMGTIEGITYTITLGKVTEEDEVDYETMFNIVVIEGEMNQ